MEKLVKVCDECGAYPAETVRVKLNGRTLQRDLCAEDRADLFKGWKRAPRGRPKGQ